MTFLQHPEQVEQWGIFEIALQGKSEGNPFLEVHLSAQFGQNHRAIPVEGFYDGDGIYRIRFMPDAQGVWYYRIQSTLVDFDGIEGSFLCLAATANNHGPVSVQQVAHFAYADGTPYRPLGTTCYAWTHQGDQLEEQTLATLKTAPFNKVRMCVFPKSYLFNENEPSFYPFPCLSRGSSRWESDQAMRGEMDPAWVFDLERFEPALFQHFESRVADLLALGIEADVILFHPYDRWGFSRLSAESEERYLRYVVARLASYRNVWWSIANEYDLFHHKTIAAWDRNFHILQEYDPYQHLRSIHNCFPFYDHAKPWITHQSIQTTGWLDVRQARIWREQVKKPVIIDECGYEGNLAQHWGNLPASEMVHRFWEGVANGGYVSHGETYLHEQDVLWWAKGGVLHGESTPRLAFLRDCLAQSPATGLDPVADLFAVMSEFSSASQPHQYYLTYFGRNQPAQVTLNLPVNEQYQGEIIDTWEMTITSLAEPVVHGAVITLPGRPFQALVLRRME